MKSLLVLPIIGGLVLLFALRKRAKWAVGDSAYYYDDMGWIKFTIIDLTKLDQTLSYLISDGLGRRFWISVKEFDKRLFSDAPIA